MTANDHRLMSDDSFHAAMTVFSIASATDDLIEIDAMHPNLIQADLAELTRCHAKLGRILSKHERTI